jgi:hypothetical protein
MGADIVFLFKRHDGSQEDLSYRECITPNTEYSILQKALRMEIQDQIDEFRIQHKLTTLCSICKNTLNKNNHVDHDNPQFIELVDNFIKPNMNLIIQHEDQDCATKKPNKVWLKDRILANKWCEFHKTNASLRMTCATCNLKRKKAKRK